MPGIPKLIEVCANCGAQVYWDKNGDPVHNCAVLSLQFMTYEKALDLGIIKASV